VPASFDCSKVLIGCKNGSLFKPIINRRSAQPTSFGTQGSTALTIYQDLRELLTERANFNIVRFNSLDGYSTAPQS